MFVYITMLIYVYILVHVCLYIYIYINPTLISSLQCLCNLCPDEKINIIKYFYFIK